MKATREILERARRSGWVGADKALAEVEAVEKAARDVTREGGDWGDPDAPAWDVLRSIAKGES